MATFTLPTSKQRPLLDPNVFPKKPGFDYAGRADEAWREIEANIRALGLEERRYQRAEKRWLDGAVWLVHNRADEQYDEAYRLWNELKNEMQSLAINAASLHKVIWWNVCTLYACLYHADRADWIEQHDVTFDGLTPEGIWEAVMPGHPAPGSWPEGKEEKYIERKVTYLGWQLKDD